jgi:Tol biopolymer transport system component
LTVVGTGGFSQPVSQDLRRYAYPRYSPDGTRISVTVMTSSGSDIWIYETTSQTFQRLTTEGINERQEWTPDGRRVVFQSNRGNGSEFWWQAADGSAPAERLLSTGQLLREGVFSPDGRVLLYRADDRKTLDDLWYVRLDGDRRPQPFLVTPFTETLPRMSPDGRWVAYQSDESGPSQIYVRPFPGPGSRYQVSNNGGTEPLWSRDGKRLVYRNGAQFVDASITTAPAFSVSARRIIVEGDFPTGGNLHQNYDLAPDAARILVVKAAGKTERTIVVHDWKHELRAQTTSARP